MWRPPGSIKHSLQKLNWPSKEEAASSRWFSTVQLGPISLCQRTWIPAMVPWRATEDGFVSDEVIAWYRRFAEGQPGAIVIEATGIRDVPSGPLLRIGHDRFLPGLEKLVNAVHEASDGKTRLLIQIIDFLSLRKRPTKENYFQRYLEITQQHRDLLNRESAPDETIRDLLMNSSESSLETLLTPRELESYRFGYRESVNDIELEHIRTLPKLLPQLFADAALRAKNIGFDGVELHYAHAYTMASFLSKRNTRPDGYGVSLENRVKLPLEVYEAARQKVGSGYTLGCRLLTDEIIEAGSHIDDAMYYAVKFAEAGMDFLSLSRGGKFEDAKQPPVGRSVYPYTGQSGYECMPTVNSDKFGPFGRNIDDTAKILKALREVGHDTPIIAAGGIHSFYQAEMILKEGKADIVASARQSLADPDWFKKIYSGRGEEIRRCKFTNYCEVLDQKHKEVTCQQWDRLNRKDPDVTFCSDGRRRMVPPAWEP